MKTSRPACYTRAFLATAALLASISAHSSCRDLPEVSQVVAADARIQADNRAVSETALYSFALFSYRNIADDAISGHGIYLDTIAGSLAPDCDPAVDVASWVRALLAVSDSSVTFSRRLAIAGSFAGPTTHPH